MLRPRTGGCFPRMDGLITHGVPCTQAVVLQARPQQKTGKASISIFFRPCLPSRKSASANERPPVGSISRSSCIDKCTSQRKTQAVTPPSPSVPSTPGCANLKYTMCLHLDAFSLPFLSLSSLPPHQYPFLVFTPWQPCETLSLGTVRPSLPP